MRIKWRCGNCEKPLEVIDGVPVSQSLAFRTGNGMDIRVHFCSLRCVWWGGQKYARSTNPGAATTKRTFKALYPQAVE